MDAHPRHAGLLTAVNRRLREELASLQVEVHDEKRRRVDVGKGERFGFVGVDVRRIRSRRGVWRPQVTPKLQTRTALRRDLKEGFRRSQSQPVGRGLAQITPMLRGGVTYFAIGNSNRCVSYVRDWVEQTVRRPLMRARNRPGLGWTRGSRQRLYATCGWYRDDRMRYVGAPSTALPTREVP